MDLDFGLEDISLRELSVVQKVGGSVQGVVVEHDVNGANMSKAPPVTVNNNKHYACVRMPCAMKLQLQWYRGI